ncbi:MAG: CBS domain-containing protein [Sedimentisphaerales bacterium]|nr:CBS domain-containing protein [Sedimentisphaerales bacterium]
MQVKDIMTRDVQVVSPEASVLDAARKMRSFDIGCLPVCKGQKCVGIFTDRDIVIRAVAEGRNLQNTKVGDIMTPTIVYCSPDDDIELIVKLMENKQLRRILVLDEDKYPVGICSVGDVALDSGDLQLAGEVMHEVARHGW